jgi:uncharacterized protein with HEPN domain
MSVGRLGSDYVADIVDAIEKIHTFVVGMDYASFAADEKTVFAVTRAFEIIGEAAKKISDETRSRYASIPWKSMAGMRDMLIHAYFGVDTQVLWQTIQCDLPNLVKQMRALLEAMALDE